MRHRVDLGRAVREIVPPRGVLELAAAVGELVRAERRGVRLERVGGTTDLVGVAGLEPAPGRGDQRGRIVDELVDQLGDERVVAADTFGEPREDATSIRSPSAVRDGAAVASAGSGSA